MQVKEEIWPIKTRECFKFEELLNDFAEVIQFSGSKVLISGAEEERRRTETENLYYWP